MSDLTIGLTQEYTHIDVQGSTNIILPEWTGSPTDDLSRKVIMLVEPTGVGLPFPITWALQLGAAPGGSPEDPSAATILWADNNVLSSIGGAGVNSNPETIIVELWEAELPSGGFGWYGKWTTFNTGPIPSPSSVTGLQLFTPGRLTQSGIPNYGSVVHIMDTIDFVGSDDIYVYAGVAPTMNTKYFVFYDKIGYGFDILGIVDIQANNNVGTGFIDGDVTLTLGDRVFLTNVDVVGGGDLENLTVTVPGCKTPTVCTV